MTNFLKLSTTNHWKEVVLPAVYQRSQHTFDRKLAHLCRAS